MSKATSAPKGNSLAEERERCAKVCTDLVMDGEDDELWNQAVERCAKEIRNLK